MTHKLEHANVSMKHETGFFRRFSQFHNISAQSTGTQSLSVRHNFPDSSHYFSSRFALYFIAFRAHKFFRSKLEAIDEKKIFLASPLWTFQISQKVQRLARKFQLTIVALGLLGEFCFVHVVFTLRHLGWLWISLVSFKIVLILNANTSVLDWILYATDWIDFLNLRRMVRDTGFELQKYLNLTILLLHAFKKEPWI